MGPLLASESIMEAGRRPITRSLNELLEEYDLKDESLKGVAHILKVLEKYGISLDPRFEDEGNLDTKRTLKAALEIESLIQEITTLITDGGEDYSVELKSSIRIDRNKQRANPHLSTEDCVSPKLSTKLAQEICAFLNRDGGTIYLGIKNDNTVCGCQDDFDSLSGDGSNADKADLIIRKIVEKNFVNANKVLSYLCIECVDYDRLPVVIIKIAKSSHLSFLKKDCGSSSQLYLRIGTSAIPIAYQDIEQYYSMIMS